MLNRRAFLQSTALAFPLAGCTSAGVRQERSVGNLTPQQMEEVQRNAAQFEKALESIRTADIPYAVEPRFYATNG